MSVRVFNWPPGKVQSRISQSWKSGSSRWKAEDQASTFSTEFVWIVFVPFLRLVIVCLWNQIQPLDCVQVVCSPQELEREKKCQSSNMFPTYWMTGISFLSHYICWLHIVTKHRDLLWKVSPFVKPDLIYLMTKNKFWCGLQRKLTNKALRQVIPKLLVPTPSILTESLHPHVLSPRPATRDWLLRRRIRHPPVSRVHRPATGHRGPLAWAVDGPLGSRRRSLYNQGLGSWVGGILSTLGTGNIGLCIYSDIVLNLVSFSLNLVSFLLNWSGRKLQTEKIKLET